jgi:RNA polymerase sigma-70 factor (ECF subfamily)
MPIDEVAEPLPTVGTPGLGGRQIKRTDLEEALKDLPPNERLTFLLRDVEGYPAEKVAELLEIPRQQVERTLFSARIRLRSILTANANPKAQAA